MHHSCYVAGAKGLFSLDALYQVMSMTLLGPHKSSLTITYTRILSSSGRQETAYAPLGISRFFFGLSYSQFTTA